MSSIFNDDSESTIKENTLSFINGQFDLAIKLSSPDKIIDYSSLDKLDSNIGNHNLLNLGDNFEF